MKNVNKNLAKDSFALFIGTASESLVTMLVGMLLVRHFTDKTVFATYAQTMMLAQTLLAIVPLGFHRAIIYFLPRVQSQRAFVLQTTAATSGLILLAALVLMVFRGQVGLWFNNASLSITIPFIIILLWLMNLHSILLQILIGTYRTRLAGLLLMITSILYLAGIVLSVIAGLGFIEILKVIIALCAMKAVLGVWFIVKMPGEWRYIGDIPLLRAQFAYSLPLGMTSFLGAIGKVIDRLIVMTTFPPAVFAVYDRGATSIPFANLIPHSISNAMMPHLTEYHANNDVRGFRYLWHESIVKTATVLIPLTIIGWLAAPHLIVFMNTQEYVDSAVYFRIYLFLLPLQLTAFPAILMAIGNTKRIFSISLLSLTLKIGISVLLVTICGMGPQGPAVGLVLAETLSTMMYLYVLADYFNISLSKVYPWRALGAILVAALVAGLIVYPMTGLHVALFTEYMFDLNALLAVAVIGLCYSVLYIGIGLLLKVFKWHEMVSLLQIFRLR